MEYYPKKPLEDEENPDKTGESKTSKKKKGNRKFPLPVEKGQAEKPTEKPEKTADIFNAKSEHPKKPKEEDEGIDEPLELPEVQPAEQEEPYLGELIIDHSDEAGQAESSETSEEFAEEAAAVDNETEAAMEPLSFIDQGQAEEQVEAAADPVYEIPQAPLRSEPESVLMPAAEGMFNPNDWRAENAYPLKTSAEHSAGVPESEAHYRAYNAEKKGLSRGVASGVLAGWWFGRRNLSRQIDRQQAERYQAAQKDIERVDSRVDDLEETIKKRESAFERAQSRLRAIVERNWDTNVFKRNETLAPYKLEKRSVSKPESRLKDTFITPLVAVRKPVEEIPRKPIEDQEITEEMYQTPKGSRYEKSAWHNIEVEEKTGKLVERPAFEYGEAFHQEQQQERLARESKQVQSAAKVALAMSAASPRPLQAVITEPPASSKIEKPVVSSADIAFVKQQLTYQITHPATWATAVAILALLLLARIV